MVNISMELVNKLNDVITNENTTIAEGMGALIWLSALAALQSEFTKKDFLLASGNLFDQIKHEEEEWNKELN
jgi:hypothetical protein